MKKRAKIDRLVINSPYREPEHHWRHDPIEDVFHLVEGRRPSGYLVASEESRHHMNRDFGALVEIPLVNEIRRRVGQWRCNGYPGVSGITKRLLDYWSSPEEFDARRFFFCQMEAIETLIWFVEAPAADRVGIDLPSDGGPFIRQCTKMATGTGKTIVMGMLIALNILNKVADPRCTKYSKNVLIIAPGLTIKQRLGVLRPNTPGNYYHSLRIVPPAFRNHLSRGTVIVQNRHVLEWENEEQITKKRGVVKIGPISDEAYARHVLGEMARSEKILVINDEAHHAWRMSTMPTHGRASRKDRDIATRWISGLDRVHRVRGILRCHDFSATPLAPLEGARLGDSLFRWITSDFGLSDAIESGLVKTPRIVVSDDAMPSEQTDKSRFYHIYEDPEVKEDLTQKSPSETPLPDLVRAAYLLLGHDWNKTRQRWADTSTVPPVMISIANRTETAARIKYSIDKKKLNGAELCESDRTLHIDSKILEKAESSGQIVIPGIIESTDGAESSGNAGKIPAPKKAEMLRQMVDTVGQVGKPGEKIHHVISVGMLSEGWDAKTVTHIMGLRAFSSPLLCEQVVGRGLRRTSYEIRLQHNPVTGKEEELFDPEYVNIFGVPFAFLPHETPDHPPTSPVPKNAIHPVLEKVTHEICWPNVVRIEHTKYPRLVLDMKKVRPMILDATKTPNIVELAPVVDENPKVDLIAPLVFANLEKEYRMQQAVFEIARDILDNPQTGWAGDKGALVAQLIDLIERFITSGKIRFFPLIFSHDVSRKRVLIRFNMSRIVEHIRGAIHQQNQDKMVPVFDTFMPIGSTSDMAPWYTGKPITDAKRCHINYCVCDSTWETATANELTTSPRVQSWVKNDHLGFEILYTYLGVVRKYLPDFLIHLVTGDMLVLEVKGQEDARSLAKRAALDEWVRAINSHGGFGHWRSDVLYAPGDIKGILERACE